MLPYSCSYKAKRDNAQRENKYKSIKCLFAYKIQRGPCTQNGDFCYTVDFFLSHVRICREPRR